MTDRQKKFMQFIEDFIRDNGYSPSIREIAKGLGLSSTSSVKKMLDRLTEKGLLNRSGSIARSIEMPNRGIPVVGRIVAGVPVEAEENIEGYMKLDRLTIRSGGHFFLKVDGDSMKDEAILHGDYVLIKPGPIITNGQIGAFRINGEVTLKTFRQNAEGIYLMPANEAFEPIPVGEYDDFEVIGTLKMVLRMANGGHVFNPA
ncbi:transcriptional repressor, LexA family [Denitrovibrio acetiphilus DSM 12809]|uniref:Transcriptional repressor, LexA family n=1 Tax=Denitrovibrio acetiphilus (strain DSM 12809 / NBRC 114555 / N2460) TaxID=522772 RepID=D4H7Z6_DENA2|nr:transcriptional repressor LexA [Denitrovibrio acetiphilus]ADD68145.1 transcriptional repressor, LexA family [Denitrovibrio acetiphilus DSM 12809]